MQVRKRNLSLFYSVKVGDWVDKRLTYETDVQVDCVDFSHGDWGKERHMPSGEMIGLTIWDLSGVLSGRPVNFKDPCCRPWWHGHAQHMHAFWRSYDTSKIQDIEEAFTPVKLDLKERVISNRESDEVLIDGIYGVVESLKSKGVSEIETRQLENILNTSGIPGRMQSLGRYLRDMGITRKQKSGGSYYYILN